jgi:hypothetical protein
MKTYLVEYVDPKTQVRMSTKINAEDKTDARDKFFDTFPAVELVERITWTPNEPA